MDRKKCIGSMIDSCLLVVCGGVRGVLMLNFDFDPLNLEFWQHKLFAFYEYCVSLELMYVHIYLFIYFFYPSK